MGIGSGRGGWVHGFSLKKKSLSPPGKPAPPRQSPRIKRFGLCGLLSFGGPKFSAQSAFFSELRSPVRQI
ncbi:uncharacterized protein DS421_14g464140 [Arachis hypogaea]|nr:uncharacterized protein DS421_14g464140 [Arachis hypogaea]